MRALALILFCSSLTSCQMVKILFFFKQPRFEIESVSSEKLNFPQLLFKPEVELTLHVQADNRNDFDLRAKSDRIEIYLGDNQKIAEAVSLDATLKKNEQTLLQVPVKIRLTQALAGVLSNLNKDETQTLRFQGKIQFHAGSYSHSRTIDIRKTLPKLF